ncbi:MAG: thioredoxin fold domain-containing protein [Litorivicinus sp.]
MTLRSLLLSALAVNAGTALAHDFSANPAPTVVYVKQADCRFCARLESEVLSPLKASGLFDGVVDFAEVSLDLGEMVTDHQGNLISGQDFAGRYGAYGTPTLVFLNAAGEAQDEPWYGVPDALDFYGAKIEGAVAGLQNPKR